MGKTASKDTPRVQPSVYQGADYDWGGTLIVSGTYQPGPKRPSGSGFVLVDVLRKRNACATPREWARGAKTSSDGLQQVLYLE
eukprot:6201301-Pleurochrysis_carterae.AAC.1